MEVLQLRYHLENGPAWNESASLRAIKGTSSRWRRRWFHCLACCRWNTSTDSIPRLLVVMANAVEMSWSWKYVVSQAAVRHGYPGYASYKHKGPPDQRSMKMGLFGFLFGDSNRDKKARDSWRPSVFGKNLISPINEYGTCFGCGGSGTRTLECRPCGGSGCHSGECRGCRGTGRFERPAQPCFTCEGVGQKFGNPCRRCGGSGNFKPAVSDVCRQCSGSGQFSTTCNKCSGARTFTVTCRKCEGTGWHKRQR